MGLYVLIIILREFSSILRPLTIAFMLSVIFVPSLDPNLKKKKWSWILPVLIVLVLAALLLVILNPLSEEVAYLDEDYEDLMGNNGTFVSPIIVNSSSELTFYGKFLNLNSEQFTGLYLKVLDYSFRFISDFIAEFIVLILFLIFLLSAYPSSLKPFIQSKSEYVDAFIELRKTIKDYLFAKTVLSAITAIISFLIMWYFKVDFKIILAVGIFLFNFIPTFGSIAAVILIILVQFFSVGFSFSLVILGLFLVLVQLVIGNYLDPKYVGKKLKMSPLIVLLSLLFWGIVWGIPGMFFSVPLTSMVFILSKHFSFGSK